ncbi:hypothetical protein NQ317_016679 [Molorchus minor]|uniref:DNA-directed DNA polymerase n=1 Tax=Molorchus minor TaxID=1323400 RepID=A0ABQ9IR26_9CUCU|nr:hypothetical protein NQ317_016679 [Molorchus minor]
MTQEECTHNDEEKALTGTWIIAEVLKAVEKGMMNKFIKIKQEASGLPWTCVSQEQKDHYIADFLSREDVTLEFTEIENIPELRPLAKLTLRLSEVLGSYLVCLQFGIYVNALISIREETVVVNYEHREEAHQSLSTVNVMIAAYVTAQARLKLYSYLEKLGERVLYYNTDSVIYVSRNNEFDIPIGEFIGDMTDELQSYGVSSHIMEFVSGELKFMRIVFSTEYKEDNVVCKVKGIDLNYSASRVHLLSKPYQCYPSLFGYVRVDHTVSGSPVPGTRKPGTRSTGTESGTRLLISGIGLKKFAGYPLPGIL